ncbi:MAG TPA: ATP-binding cassette domain-containing protein [Patescibacteria group bacterium]|nr:ATP-binding cassette domain-containing protein [Patescibacteria group bacterium]
MQPSDTTYLRHLGPAVVVENVRKSFKDVKALDGINLTIAPGTVFGLLGPNGAGKTTLVRALTTLLKPDSGKVYVAGFDVALEPQRVRERIGLAGQYAAVDENLTGLENLEMVGRLYHLPKKEARNRAKELLERFSLTDAGNRQLKTYSGGMRRRLDLGASLVGNPQILFLDEPTAGLDPQSRLSLWEMIKSLVAEGTTLLLTTQYLEEADYLADTIAIIDHGRMIAQGTAQELKTQVGGDVVELHVLHKDQIADAVGAIVHLGSGETRIDSTTGQITLPIQGGTKSLVECIRALDAAHIEIADINLRRPTLDEVFLKLTGRTT